MIEGILAPWHWIILIVVLMLIFGPSKLPGIASSIGKGISGVRKEIKDISEDTSGAIGELKDLNPLSPLSDGDDEPSKAAAEPAEEAPTKSSPGVTTLKTLAAPGGLKRMTSAAAVRKIGSPTAALGKYLLSDDEAPAAPTVSAEDKPSENKAGEPTQR